MNVKSMFVGLLIVVVASTGTYFPAPPPSGAEASNCATKYGVQSGLERLENRMGLDKAIILQHLSDHNRGVLQLLAVSSSSDANLIMFQNIMNALTETHRSLLEAMNAAR